jgi:type V secretory pathway adhesin AidA
MKREVSELRHRLIDLMDGRQVLSGGIAGRRLLTALITATPPADTPTRVFLDFEGIEVATASFLRETVIGFRDYVRLSLNNVYVVVANLAPAILEELEFFIRARGEALWMCELDGQGRVHSPRMLGELDPVQRATFEAVAELGAATASGLAAKFSDQRIGPTAWNNRLSSLAAKGLLVERRVGKSKSFSPLLEIA